MARGIGVCVPARSDGQDCPLLRATFSPAHPLARRDVPLTRRAPSERARSASKKGTLPLPPLFRDRALREQGESSGHPLRLDELTPSAERRNLSLAFEPYKEDTPWEFSRYRIGH